MASQPGPPRVANLTRVRIRSATSHGLAGSSVAASPSSCRSSKRSPPCRDSSRGTGFVLVTALGLYVLLARRSKFIVAAQRELISVNEQRARMVAAVEQSAEAIVITDTVRDHVCQPRFQRVRATRKRAHRGTPRIARAVSTTWSSGTTVAVLLRGETLAWPYHQSSKTSLYSDYRKSRRFRPGPVRSSSMSAPHDTLARGSRASPG